MHDDYRVEEYEDSLFDAMGQNQINDIALVLAEKRFRFTDFVGPATLANREDDENVLNEKYFRIYGWGPHVASTNKAMKARGCARAWWCGRTGKSC